MVTPPLVYARVGRVSPYNRKFPARSLCILLMEEVCAMSRPCMLQCQVFYVLQIRLLK